MMVLYSGTTCPYSHRCRFVLFEKLPESFTAANDAEDFRTDFLKMKKALAHVA